MEMECKCSTSESILLIIRAIIITLLFGILLHKLNQTDKLKETKYRVYLGAGVGLFAMYFVLMALQSFFWYRPFQLLLYGLDLKATAFIIYSLVFKDPYIPFMK